MESSSRRERHELGIGLTEELDGQPGQSIADEEGADEKPRLAPASVNQKAEGQHEQGQPLQPGLVELAGMTG
jgi:hypothetical protein